MNTIEVWKNVLGYEGLYQVSNLGRIKSLCRKTKRGNISYKVRILKPGLTDGYERVVLTKYGLRNTKKVHRLVAQAFIPNLKNKPQVNHIDFNRSNNIVANLEWSTQLENNRHSRKNDRYPKIIHSKEYLKRLETMHSKKVIDKSTGIIYRSASQAAEILNIKKSTLIHYLRGSRTNKTNLEYLKKT